MPALPLGDTTPGCQAGSGAPSWAPPPLSCDFPAWDGFDWLASTLLCHLGPDTGVPQPERPLSRLSKALLELSGRQGIGAEGPCCWKAPVGLSGAGQRAGTGQVQVSGRWQAQGAVRAGGLGLLPSSAPSPAKRGRTRPLRGSGSELGSPSGQQSCPQDPGHGALEFWRTPGPLVAPATPRCGTLSENPTEGSARPSFSPRSLLKAHTGASVLGVT